MKLLPQSLLIRPRLLIAMGAIALLAILLPSEWHWTTRFLVAWDAGAIVYLGLLTTMIFGEDVEQIKARAAEQDEGALAILIIACLAAAASVAAIGIQLAGLNAVPSDQKGLHLALGGVTILCSWMLVHAFFTLHYAHDFYSGDDSRGGLDFPGDAEPNYVDFLYFSYTIGCTSQTSDIGVTTRQVRIIVLAHSVLSFFFNTSILAFGINVGASLVSGS
ncbi:DUF1345 domain-containing protein [Bosea caraganae]|uniref:DUF1345 domain-containing protein n=1 Tax=Bosea caraganae TaxID=2763117 RepID=A0A370KXW5_9HYPH|nr:DUF1345 domain-containing protein [Bosea caraganae]RDJ19796.1 DUF1345 domain-containing protein [Bosea caraganae]RDJ21101.1 DUF1345 domain-containing protein [Bosea caraganae]